MSRTANTKDKITIVTCLDERVAGGREATIRHTWPIGPRNMIKAIDHLPQHRIEMEQSYGNVGCGSSWIEIAGIRFTNYDAMSYAFDTEEPHSEYIKRISKTEWCRNFIEKIKSAK